MKINIANRSKLFEDWKILSPPHVIVSKGGTRGVAAGSVCEGMYQQGVDDDGSGA